MERCARLWSGVPVERCASGCGACACRASNRAEGAPSRGGIVLENSGGTTGAPPDAAVLAVPLVEIILALRAALTQMGRHTVNITDAVQGHP